MQRVEFVSLDRKVNYDNAEVLFIRHYSNTKPEKDKTGSNKNRLYLIVANEHGIPYAYEIGKLVRKYSSGKIQDPVMIHRMSESIKEQELLLNSEGQIENLDKIIKNALSSWGYR